MTKKYISFKLTSGQELVGEVDSKEDYLNVVNPVELLHDYDSQGFSIVKLVPFLTWVENELFTFAYSHVIVTGEPNEKLIKYYEQYIKSLKESETNNDSFIEYGPYCSDTKH